ncbi:DNA-3-methyladenine glycosylase I [Thalassobaculum sp. OXR-137]|uniref:DNA-3-methyladenine glycosylase I n=1 Tax=Thalassobaculum sp. OXR-137 TaxID=3100173 RepID=UPI002AC8EF1E|nr:DNA-3-methyladenine glycosylase I [Thalassobaculum sp. OXR-137]WPZ36028.1 DNA-3-methyladenine glycosylase I [Thalassobaculum sp. OXR-137]
MTASFDDLYARAAARKGGDAALEALLGTPKSAAELAAIPDERWLSDMTRRIFQSGFNWKVIDAKWDGFEAAFWGFDVGRCALMSDEDLDALVSDTRIVRNGAKIRSVRENAAFLQDLAAEYGSAAKCFAEWPAEDYAGLLEMLKKRGSRLGGRVGAIAMRFMGRDGYVLSEDVVTALIREGVVDKEPTSRRDVAAVQAAFNAWAAQSGRPLSHISRVLAFGVDA